MAPLNFPPHRGKADSNSTTKFPQQLFASTVFRQVVLATATASTATIPIANSTGNNDLHVSDLLWTAATRVTGEASFLARFANIQQHRYRPRATQATQQWHFATLSSQSPSNTDVLTWVFNGGTL